MARKSGLLKAFGTAVSTAGDVYGDYKKAEAAEGLLKQKKAEADAAQTFKQEGRDLEQESKRSAIVGVDEKGKPVTQGQINDGTFKGQLRAIPSGKGGKADDGSIDLLEQKRLNELGQQITGSEKFAIGREMKGTAPDQSAVNRLSELHGTKLILETSGLGSLRRNTWKIVPEGGATPKDTPAEKETIESGLGEPVGQVSYNGKEHDVYMSNRGDKIINAGGKWLKVPGAADEQITTAPRSMTLEEQTEKSRQNIERIKSGMSGRSAQGGQASGAAALLEGFDAPSVGPRGNIWGQRNGQTQRIMAKPSERIYNKRYPNPEFKTYQEVVGLLGAR